MAAAAAGGVRRLVVDGTGKSGRRLIQHLEEGKLMEEVYCLRFGLEKQEYDIAVTPAGILKVPRFFLG
ncbi:hypothetical protein Trydic_g2284 [Trypoxylus dichotomus]